MESITFCKGLAHSGDKTIIVIPRSVAAILDKDSLYQVTLTPVDTVSATHEVRKEAE